MPAHKFRLYVPPDQISGRSATILGPKLHHLSNVLRLKKDAHITIFDGVAKEYHAIIESITTRKADLALAPPIIIKDTDKPTITLFAPLLKRASFDLMIEKVTELGVNTIIPLVTQNTPERRAQANLDRLQRIAIAAAEQSGRIKLTDIGHIHTLEEALNHQEDTLSLIAVRHP
ncbi:MAG: RsmE family RNA methyltransferase, partial [Thermoplasmata archaeon]|nr:RsmE family RNA methyltransferase [Thermoplasmata archaeon]